MEPPHGDDLVVCPYCQPPKNHNVKYKTLASHLDKIKKSNPEMKSRRTCRYNIMHLLREDELDQHHAVCPDRRTGIYNDYTDFSPVQPITYNEDVKIESPPKPAAFRLNVNVYRPIGGRRPLNNLQPQPQPYEGPRLPVGMAPVQTEPSQAGPRKNAVTESKAFDKSHLLQ